MPRRFRGTCPHCGRPDLKNISTHLLRVHGLSPEDRKPYLKQARVSPWHPYTDLTQGEKPCEGEQLRSQENENDHHTRCGKEAQ